MAKKRKTPVVELWRRLQEDYDFLERMVVFRRENGIPPNGFLTPMDVSSARTPDGGRIISATNAFIKDLLKEYGLDDYYDELAPPLLLYITLNEVEGLRSPTHLVEPFGLSVFDGEDAVKMIKRVVEMDYDEREGYYSSPRIAYQHDIAFVEQLKKSVVIVVRPTASLADLQNLHTHTASWKEVQWIREKKHQPIDGVVIRERTKAGLYKLVYQAFLDGFITSDGRKPKNASSQELPQKYEELYGMDPYTLSKIIDEERKRRGGKRERKKMGE
jgi:hypothetical protein